MEERRSLIAFLLVGIVIGSIIGGMFGTYLVFSNPKVFPWAQNISRSVSQSEQVAEVSVSSDVLNVQSQVELIAEKISVAVVRITSTQNVVSPFFFQMIPQTGLGSGIIIREDGLILTNNHVIEDASDIEVTLSTGETYKAKVIGSDSVSDLALLKIEASNLPFVTLGDSSTVKVGQFVVAIGNPYGLDNTVSLGVVSAVERNIDTGQTTMYGVIQTDAAINPGNSGGPLVDLEGKVIGINTMIYSEGQGLGFAVSSNTAKKVVDNLLKTGKVKWPFLGVQIVTMTQQVASYYGIPFREGALIVSVQTLSPAAKAGLMKNDVIVSIDGKQVKTADDVVAIIRAHEVGEKMVLEVLRGESSTPIKIEATLGSQN